MKRFLLKTALVTAIFSLLLYVAYLVFPYNPNGYNRGYEKKVELLTSTAAPRILVVGGSNAAFGFDSPAIEDSLGMKVINTGLHAGVGFRFMIDDIATYAQPGDIVVISPEYQQFEVGGPDGAQPLADIILAMAPSKFAGLTPRQQWNVMNNLPAYMKSCILSTVVNKMTPDRKTLYSLDAFNENGDVAKHWSDNTTQYNLINDPAAAKVNIDTVFFRHLLSKIDELKRNGCTVVLLPPALSRTSFTNKKPLIDSVEKLLAAHNLKFEFDTESVAFDDSLFMDTPYHLSREGITIKNSIVIDHLRRIASNTSGYKCNATDTAGR